MTSMAFVLGCLPLAIGAGAGAAGRHSIGTGVVGGMLASTFIATYFVPLFFVGIMRLTEKLAALKTVAFMRASVLSSRNSKEST